jgi:hypothetical protein
LRRLEPSGQNASLILRDAAKTPLLRMRKRDLRHSGARVSSEPGLSQGNIEIPGLRLPRIPE